MVWKCITACLHSILNIHICREITKTLNSKYKPLRRESLITQLIPAGARVKRTI